MQGMNLYNITFKCSIQGISSKNFYLAEENHGLEELKVQTF